MNALLKSLSIPTDTFILRKNQKGVRGLFSSRSYKKNEEILRLPIYESKCRILQRSSDLLYFRQESSLYNSLSRNGQFATLLCLSRKNHKLYAYWNLIPLTKSNLSWNIWFWSTQTVTKKSKLSLKAAEYYSSYLHKLRTDYTNFGLLYDEYISKYGVMMYKMKRKTFQDKCMLYRIIISARGFGMINGQNALVPLLDLMNHGSLKSYNVNWKFMEKDKVFVMSARKNIKKNTELLDSYGHTKQPYQFMTLYGFIP